jgi:hypothetical protein
MRTKRTRSLSTSSLPYDNRNLVSLNTIQQLLSYQQSLTPFLPPPKDQETLTMFEYGQILPLT